MSSRECMIFSPCIITFEVAYAYVRTSTRGALQSHNELSNSSLGWDFSRRSVSVFGSC